MSIYGLRCVKEGYEVELFDGKVTVGRGPFLRITDKRVSRNHAVLEVLGTTVHVCPIHTNPTFYKGREETKFEPLERNQSKELEDGDCISFLPNDLIFKVIKKDIRKNIIVPVSAPDSKCIELSAKQEKIIMTGAVGLDQRHDCLQENDEPLQLVEKKRVLPSWMSSIKDKVSERKYEKNNEKGKDCKESAVDCSNENNKGVREENFDIEAKQEHSLVDKTEGMESLNVLEEEKVKRKRSVDESDGDSSNKREKKLPSCPYGHHCYRKNPIHFQEYSHSDIGEEDSEERENIEDLPECPYGEFCYRKNPHHHKQYKHTPSLKQRERRAERKKVKGSIGDDDDGLNDYDYNDSFINDESESSPEPSDSEDSDWQPEEENDSNIEDVGELLLEAKEFTSNKKMLKPT